MLPPFLFRDDLKGEGVPDRNRFHPPDGKKSTLSLTGGYSGGTRCSGGAGKDVRLSTTRARCGVIEDWLAVSVLSYLGEATAALCLPLARAFPQ
jgi:hypothetical protein